MIQPSPAPRRPTRRLWPWVVGGVGVLLVGLTALAATYPRWAAPRARRVLAAKLEARLGRPVDIDRLTLEYDAVHVQGLRFGDESARVELDRVDVKLDADALWRAQVRAVDIDVHGGRVWGTARGFESLARRLRSGSSEEADAAGRGGRVSMRPHQAAVHGVDFDIRATSAPAEPAEPSESSEPVVAGPSLPVREVRGKLAVTWSASAARAQVRATEVSAVLPGGIEGKVGALTVSLPTRDRATTFPLTVGVQDASTAITPEIAVGKVTGSVTLVDAAATELDVDLRGGFADEAGDGTGELWSLSGRGRRDLSAGKFTVKMEAFELGRVPAVLERLPLVDSATATVGGELTLDVAAGKLDAKGALEVAGLHVRHDLLAKTTVRDVSFGVDLDATVDPAAYRLDLRSATVRRQGVALSLAGTFVHPPQREGRRYEAKLSMGRTPCQDVLDALPRELVPALTQFRLRGDMDVDLAVEVDFADLDALSLTGQVGIDGCTVTATPARATPDRLAGGFNHVVRLKDGSVRRVSLFPGSRQFTPLDWISPFMVAGVRTNEDAGFWRHNGFLPSQFEEALRRNLKAGRVRLGASTVTMQMVKNVLLSHERTLSRKLQEMFLTWYVERALDKRRILEIYLNIVELGPGIYGVTDASDYYFGKHPSALNSLEAAFLTLMLPNPVGRHGMYCRDQLTPGFEKGLRRIHGIMHSRGHISAETYLTWKDAELVFDPRRRGGESACLARSHVLMEAKGTQIAVSGLLAEGADAPPDDEPPLLAPRERTLPGVSEAPEHAIDGAPAVPSEPDPVPAMDRLEALHDAELGRGEQP